MPIKLADLLPVKDMLSSEAMMFIAIMRTVDDVYLNEFYKTIRYFIKKNDYEMAKAYAMGSGEYLTADIINEIIEKEYDILD